MKTLFNKIAEENRDRIYRICRSYSTNAVDTEDLFQEVMLQVWKALPGFRNESSVNSWVFRIALNVCMRAKFSHDKRKSVFIKTDMTDIDLPNPKQEGHDPEYRELFSCIWQLNEIDKSIILLFLENQSYREIGEITGRTENNIATRMKRIKQKLYTCLKPRL